MNSEKYNRGAKSSTTTDTNKRRADEDLSTRVKRIKLEVSSQDNGIIEDAVRRYLTCQPMTTTELIIKFRNKKTGLSPETLVKTMAHVLKQLNPVQQTFEGKLYLSLQRI